MIAVRCTRCGATLDEPGALVFSPPRSDICSKHHLCSLCWADLSEWLLAL